MSTKIEQLPTIPLRGLAIFPRMVLHFDVGRPSSSTALEAAMMLDQRVLLVAQRDERLENPGHGDLREVGIVVKVKQMIRLPGDLSRVLVEGLERARLLAPLPQEGYLRYEVQIEPDTQPDDISLHAYQRAALDAFSEFALLSDRISGDVAHTIGDIEDPAQLCDAIAANALDRFDDRQAVLEEGDLGERFFLVTRLLKRECDIMRAEKKVHIRVKGQIEKNQREYYLREQIKAIHKELGEQEAENEIEEFRKKAKALPLNDEARDKVNRELERIGRIAQSSPEYSVSRNYLEWMLAIPWEETTQDNLDLTHARDVLDQDHYGLTKVKERILEYLAVRKLTGTLKGPILCFVGPPGVGKTSVARSIARAIGRNFARMSLGGMRDEAEIRGHRRTYIGAIPGRLITSMRTAGTINPLVLLDEIDKLASDFRGDPASALLEVLDSEQNNTFRDHYLDIPYDLSHVLFITTANSLDTIARPLLDRMEIIEVPGYTEDEKVQIAKRHLIPKQIKENGLSATPPVFLDEALRALIRGYTRESGVRSLERKVSSLCRKVAAQVADGRDKPMRITKAAVGRMMGPVTFLDDAQSEVPQIGVVTGLAYTAYGGDTLCIEATPMPGKGKLELTGHLGEVMQESARTGFAYIRSHAEALSIDPLFYTTNDMHLHVPAGATPKDGPSAGLAMAAAMISALTGRLVRQDVAMTGEITLRGRALPIGGLKEKTLAAHRAGMKTVLYPAANEKDLQDIPAEVRAKIKMKAVTSLDDVLREVLLPKEAQT